MYFEFNVSINGRHFFRTGDSITTQEHAERVNKELRDRFPTSEGFAVSCSQWSKTGQGVDFGDVPSFGIKLVDTITHDQIDELDASLCRAGMEGIPDNL